MSYYQLDEDGFASHLIGIANEVLAIIVFIAFGIASTLFYSYMNSVPLEKKCILLDLYKDVISSMVWRRSTLMIRSLFNSWITDGTSRVPAIIISFALWFGSLYMAMIIVLISIYKLYMAKTKTIDPQLPFMGEDEVSAIKKIRIVCSLIAVGFLSTTFSMGMFPNNFNAMRPNQEPEDDPLISFIIYHGLIVLLVLVSGFITIARKYYESITELQIDKIIPKSIKYIAFLIIITFGGAIVVEALQFNGKMILFKIYHIVLSLLLIFGPFVMIYRSKQLKTHSIRILKNKLDDIFMLNIYLVPVFVFVLINISMFMIFK